MTDICELISEVISDLDSIVQNTEDMELWGKLMDIKAKLQLMGLS